MLSSNTKTPPTWASVPPAPKRGLGEVSTGPSIPPLPEHDVRIPTSVAMSSHLTALSGVLIVGLVMDVLMILDCHDNVMFHCTSGIHTLTPPFKERELGPSPLDCG